MFEVFKKYLANKIILSEQELELIQSVAIIKKLRKHQYLLQAGDVWHYNAFVCGGFVRTYFVDNKGHESIMNFAPENHWTGDRESLASEQPSRYYIDALEDSVILLIKKADFDMLCQEIPVFNNLVNNLLQKSFVVAQDRIHANITLTAEEKYHYFITKFPAIANRVPQHMIASYLGLTPETLTRVRRTAHKK